MNENKYLDNIIKGIRLGLVAFLICFGVSVFCSIIINYVFLDDINRLLNGSLSQNPNPGLGSLMLIISVMLNMTVFNNGGLLENGGSMHMGLLLFIALPVLAFIIAGRNNNKTKHFNKYDMMEYLASSITFSIELYLLSVFANGFLLGVEVRYTNVRNLFMTIVILMCVQVFIGLNYKKNFTQGVECTRFILRVLIGIGLICGGIGMLLVFSKYLGSIGLTIVATIALLPNIAVYIMFMFMGVSVEFGQQLQTLMGQIGVDLSFAVLALPVRLIMVILFFGLILHSVWKIDEKEYVKHVGLFGFSFSGISFVLAYSTTINLGFVKNLLDVEFGINYVFAFVMPMVLVFLAGALVWLIRYLIVYMKKAVD